MPNKNYIKGRAKEYRVKKKLEQEGYIVLRTAGSHGFADLIAIDRKEMLIRFIQCKPKNFSKQETKRLLEQYKWIRNEVIFTDFEVI